MILHFSLRISLLIFLFVGDGFGTRILQAAHDEDIPHLIKLLDAKDEKTRVRAIISLYEAGPRARPAASRLLTALLREKTQTTASMAGKALGAIGPETLPILMRAMKTGTPKSRRRIVAALAECSWEDKVILPPLQQALNDPDPQVRKVATFGLGTRRDPAALPSLIRVVRSDADSYVRSEAIRLLGDFGSTAESAVPALLEVVEKEATPPGGLADPYLGKAAAEALFTIRGKEGIPPLLALAEDRKKHRDARSLALWSLRQLASTTALDWKTRIPRVQKLLLERDAGLRRGAIELLGTVGRDAREALSALRPLLSLPDPRDRIVVAEAIYSISGESTIIVPALANALQAKDWLARVEAAAALERIGSPAKAAIPALVRAAQDANPDVRFGAVTALGEMGKLPDHAMTFLRGLEKDEDPHVRQRAREVLKRLEPKP
jgi:HEAT repeat protein